MRRLVCSFTLLASLVLVIPSAAGAGGDGLPAFETAHGAPAQSSTAERPGKSRWSWPVTAPRRVLRAYRAPSHAYGPGHRGIDVFAPEGTPVLAVEDGRIAFAARVVDRELVTIEHTGALVSTVEPVVPAVRAGTFVRRGDVVGHLARGGHAPSGALHLGARLDGDYVNPLRFLGGIPRSILLPCCATGG